MSIITLLVLFLITRLFFVSSESVRRADFPHGFTFGTASSAYQELSMKETREIAYGIPSLENQGRLWTSAMQTRLLISIIGLR
ncbi:hypothetical protein QQP08_021002 [Theobroma cacao]|nr:hypothetical protein QQP08_021002 [Theobroma cacao]